MSVFTFDAKAGNPVTTDTIVSLANELGVKEHTQIELEQYKTLLAVFHDACEELDEMDDYLPEVDYERFPRKDPYFPQPEDNKLGAWGYKCEVKDLKYTGGGLLDGSNIAVKDCIAIAGVPMLLGTNFVKDYVPKTDAVVITRLMEAGATIQGKAVCENLCHSATSHSAGTGPVHNPLAIGYSTGGSSSGSAALVMDPEEDIDITIGADQGGSVRIPAGWCGAVGLKPTFGLIPFTGCAGNEATNDHLGVLTRDVLTNAKGLQAIAGSDGIDDRSFGAQTSDYYYDLLDLSDPKCLKGLKIAILKEGFENRAVEQRVKDTCLAAIKKFKELGATVEEVSIPLHSKGALIWTGVSKIGGYLTKMGNNIGRRGVSLNDLTQKFLEAAHTQENWDQAYPSSKNIYYNGMYAEKKFPGLYGKCTNLSRKLRDSYNKVLEEYDLIVLPNLPYIARSHAEIGPNATPLELIGKQVGLSSNTAPFDQSGHPALALPVGMLPILEGPLADSGTKLPVSLQIVGQWFDEKTVYRAAYAFEKSYNWKDL
ncbi:amidase [Yamadazyma tenuis]|uniref:Amidase n=1 Tax=Candida tenuis (strain ATCC 10573 / BCRC 21748 / CBS 615 / JCM 9827 / NBRC 10315 / NRRL Y-1498 / VKM Y-70) TaxID=590646 RepID=G3B888_CANTC|nr:amidase [Yamadazyma tenuis ATCC 10573]EGV61713.1 amidase [Yamadazyma tenuis ATCC 10573]WEJ92946.1 amidase [Yamadazyma tenuis]